MSQNFNDSIVLITSSDKNIRKFGTGFVLRQSRSFVYVITCAHVVRDLESTEQICIDGNPASLAISGEVDGIDLAVLKVAGLWQKPVLNKKKVEDEKGRSVMTIGFQQHDQKRLLRPLEGELGNQVELQINQSEERIQAWDLQIIDDHTLQPGYSGSPVIDQETGSVIGIVSHRHGLGESGLAISISALDKIWSIIDADRVYQLLLKLGYRQQVRQFRNLIRTNSVAAVLIHGLPQSGQRWLLNRLISQEVTKILQTKPIVLHFDSRVRRSDVGALWRELGRFVGLSQAKPGEIIRRVYRRWKTQNILIVIHDVDVLPKPKEKVSELIDQFWTPLVKKTEEKHQPKKEYKLLMFLIDYQGKIGELDLPFVERLDTTWNPKLPFIAPKIEDFSDEELRDWIERESNDLPTSFNNEDVIIQEILNNSDNGIPEYVLQDICERCGCDWYEELEKLWKKV